MLTLTTSSQNANQRRPLARVRSPDGCTGGGAAGAAASCGIIRGAALIADAWTRDQSPSPLSCLPQGGGAIRATSGCFAPRRPAAHPMPNSTRPTPRERLEFTEEPRITRVNTASAPRRVCAPTPRRESTWVPLFRRVIARRTHPCYNGRAVAEQGAHAGDGATTRWRTDHAVGKLSR